jgi:ELWxxDGT repeat protein
MMMALKIFLAFIASLTWSGCAGEQASVSQLRGKRITLPSESPQGQGNGAESFTSQTPEPDVETANPSPTPSPSTASAGNTNSPAQLIAPSIAVQRHALDQARISWLAQAGVSYRIDYAEGDLTYQQILSATDRQTLTFAAADSESSAQQIVEDLPMDRKLSFVVEAKRGDETIASSVVVYVPGALLTDDWSSQKFGLKSFPSGCDYSLFFGQRVFLAKTSPAGACSFFEYVASGNLKRLPELLPYGEIKLFGNRLVNFTASGYASYDNSPTPTTVNWSVPSGLNAYPAYKYINEHKIFLFYKETATNTRRLYSANWGESNLTELMSFNSDAYSKYVSGPDGSIAFATWDYKVVVSDGTLLGTRVVSNRSGRTFQYMVADGDYFYFSVMGGNEIFRAQFSGTGTSSSFYAGMTFGSPQALNQKILFVHSTTLYAYDPFDPHSGSCVANGKLAPSVGGGCIRSLRTGLSSIGGAPEAYYAVAHGFEQNQARVGNYVTFFANDGINGKELWQTDGTAAGTTLKFAVAAGSSGFNFLANQFRIQGIDGVFFQNISGQTVSLWHYSNPSNAPSLIASFSTGLDDAAINTMNTDPTKQKLLISTSNGLAFEVPISGGTASQRPSSSLYQVSAINEDGFYFYESLASGGLLKRRNHNKSVDTITGMTANNIAISSGLLQQTEFKKLDLGTMTVSCQSSTDCDIFKIVGNAATLWSEYPDNAIPSANVMQIGENYYTKDSLGKISTITAGGTASYLTYNSSQITGVYALNPVFENELFVVENGGMGVQSKLYRINASGVLSLVHTSSPVAGTDFYVLEESVSIGTRRHFIDYAIEMSAGTSFQNFKYSLGDSSLSADLSSLSPAQVSDSNILSEVMNRQAILWRNRYYFVCMETTTITSLCSESLTGDDRQVEVSGVWTPPVMSGNKLFYEITSNDVVIRSMINSSDQSSAIPLPGGVTGRGDLTAMALNGFLIFAGQSNELGSELYISDGISTKLLVDLKPGAVSSEPKILGISGNELVVEVESGILERGLIFLDISALRQ